MAAEIGSPVARITKNTMVTRMNTVGMISRNLVNTKRKNPLDKWFFLAFGCVFAGADAVALSDTRCSFWGKTIEYG
jgi:hypothetical protein